MPREPDYVSQGHEDSDERIDVETNRDGALDWLYGIVFQAWDDGATSYGRMSLIKEARIKFPGLSLREYKGLVEEMIEKNLDDINEMGIYI
tara:strand:- start:175 stop:447 length:273 start_codon:yes stop_codon:yes gene_type:complete